MTEPPRENEQKSAIQHGAFTLEFTVRGCTTEEKAEIRKEVHEILLQMHLQARKKSTLAKTKEIKDAA